MVLKSDGHQLETKTQMAFWLRPGERSDGELARNTTILSRHIVRKQVTIGVDDLPHATSPEGVTDDWLFPGIMRGAPTAQANRASRGATAP